MLPSASMVGPAQLVKPEETVFATFQMLPPDVQVKRGGNSPVAMVPSPAPAAAEEKKAHWQQTANPSVTFGVISIGPRQYNIVQGPTELLHVHLRPSGPAGDEEGVDPYLVNTQKFYKSHQDLLAMTSGTYYEQEGAKPVYYPIGLIKVDGKQYYASRREARTNPKDPRYLLLKAGAKATDWTTMFYVRADGEPGLAPASTATQKEIQSYPTAIEVGRSLVRNGQPLPQKGPDKSEERMVVCVTKDHKVLFVTTQIDASTQRDLEVSRKQFANDLLALIPNLESAALMDGSNAAQMAARAPDGETALAGLTQRGTPNIFTFEPPAETAQRK